jgi:hypothetical protein
MDSKKMISATTDALNLSSLPLPFATYDTEEHLHCRSIHTEKGLRVLVILTWWQIFIPVTGQSTSGVQIHCIEEKVFITAIAMARSSMFVVIISLAQVITTCGQQEYR